MKIINSLRCSSVSEFWKKKSIHFFYEAHIRVIATKAILRRKKLNNNMHA